MHTKTTGDNTTVPELVKSHGYDNEQLKRAFTRAQDSLPVLAFTKPPTIEFYVQLHKFLTSWEFTRGAGMTAIGRFYIAIDPFLRQRGYLPHNSYHHIANQVANYGKKSHKYPTLTDKRIAKETICNEADSEALNESGDKTVSEDTEISTLRCVLSDVTNKMDRMKSKYEKKLQKAHDIIHDLQREIHETEEELDDVQEKYKATKQMASTGSGVSTLAGDISYHTKNGRQYSLEIRKVYYNLLVHGMSPEKISTNIKIMLRHFLPDIDVERVKLPQKSCAQYMRREELKTVNDIHKASVLAASHMMHLNSDGTTLGQQKLGAVTINGLVISVNELANGSAEQIAKDISAELEHLRTTARDLGLPNADSINWSLIVSATSDSAATQKKFNEIVKQRKKEDHDRFGTTEFTEELISNFCAMHLGVNLRKAFVQGSAGIEEPECATGAINRKYSDIDTFVHEFCKVFGNKGVPEYGAGSVSFPDFLEIGIQSGAQESDYYKVCQSVSLDRQVGSRYFVTASNAAKSLFLRKAAKQYLNLFRKNKLEVDVYEKLNDDNIMAAAKADGLMFTHVYANLVTLAKSTVLNKSAFDMRIHYLELDSFLEMLEDHPQTIFDENFQVFRSEKRLYSENVVPLADSHTAAVYKRMFTEDTWDDRVCQIVTKGTCEMRKKLHTYAKDYLPQGKYWDPSEGIQSILRKIKPSNDICESVLGLNDWLHHHNMTTANQITKRNIIEAKKNKSIPWLDSRTTQERSQILQMAADKRKEVKQWHQTHAKSIKQTRQDTMLETIKKKKEKEQMMADLKEQLSKVLVIDNSSELDAILKMIDNEDSTSKAKKVARKKELLKAQIQLRKTLFQQKLHIPFTKGGKSVPLDHLVDDFKVIMADNPIESAKAYQPTDLVGKKIEHKFYCKDTKRNKWYRGIVKRYNKETQTFTIHYNGEEKTCKFCLIADWAIGDLKIIA